MTHSELTGWADWMDDPCPCGGGNQPDRSRYCGRHLLVVTDHADGLKAGCHCGIGYKMPKDVTKAEFTSIARKVHVAHAGGVYPATGMA